MKKSFIGIDLHKNNFVACYLRNGKVSKHQTYLTSDAGFNKFFKTLKRQDCIAVEATTNAAYFCDKVRSHVDQIKVVAPSKFSQISKSHQKTDKNDAEMLALYLSRDLLPIARLKSKKSIQLRSLIDTRTQLVKMRRSLINKMHSILLRSGHKVGKDKLGSKGSFEKYVFAHKWEPIAKRELIIIHEQIMILNKNVDLLEKEITSLAQTMPGYENLVSIKGIGSLAAAIFLCIIDDIKNFESASHLCSYFGIVPSVRMSNNNYKPGSITKAGSKLGRTTLVQCTWVAMRYSPYLKEFYERIKKRRGTGKAAIACSRKLLIIIFNTLKNDWVFEDFVTYTYRPRLSVETEPVSIKKAKKKPRKIA